MQMNEQSALFVFERTKRPAQGAEIVTYERKKKQ